MVSEKIIKMSQIIGYIFKISGMARINRVKLIKLIWAADRYHIRKYGRLVTEDTYYAMEHGPVSSLALDIAQLTEWKFTKDEYDFLSHYFNSDKKETWIEGGVIIDDGYLSESDKEALDFTWNTFGKFDDFYLADKISHDYPEWQRLEEHLAQAKIESGGKSGRIEINNELFFDNPENDEYFNMLDANHLAASKEYFQEQESIKSVLRD